jgi:hypothetical protein
MSRGRLALVAILLVGLASATVIQSFSWNQTSHYDLTRAIYHGETTIDKYQANTGDKAYYKGHWYSARAPGLAVFSEPFYEALILVRAESWTDAHVAPPDHPGDEMIYLLGLWGNVLPGLLLLVLVWRVAERYEPGYGAATAVILGLGTMVLPFSQLLFSHMFTTFLCFAAFWLMLKERDGPPRPLLLAVAGLAMGYAFSSEYPTFFAALVLGLFLLSRRDALSLAGVAQRGGAYVLGGIVGIVPLLLYNHFAFHSWTHLAYSDIPRQQQGFFGIDVPNLKVLVTLLIDSRGLLTISPILIMGAIGTMMLYRRGRRAEALTIGGICLCYLGYNSGYYLPFGGGFMGPRFLDTLLPFLAFPVALTLKRFPGPTIALAAISITTTVIASITHPLIGYENETVTWMRYLSEGYFQPTIASAYGLGRGWGGIWPFLLPAAGGVLLAAFVTPRLRLPNRALGAGLLALVAWGLFAVLGPALLGIDHQGLQEIYNAGDHTAFNLKLHSGARYPLKTLALVAFVAGVLALAAMRLTRSERERPAHPHGAGATAQPGAQQLVTPAGAQNRRI